MTSERSFKNVYLNSDVCLLLIPSAEGWIKMSPEVSPYLTLTFCGSVVSTMNGWNFTIRNVFLFDKSCLVPELFLEKKIFL